MLSINILSPSILILLLTIYLARFDAGCSHSFISRSSATQLRLRTVGHTNNAYRDLDRITSNYDSSCRCIRFQTDCNDSDILYSLSTLQLVSDHRHIEFLQGSDRNSCSVGG